jgi:hypothetical protein
MGEFTVSALSQLAKCLDDASHCIDSLRNERDTEHLSAQLMSLKLILDHNCQALRLCIDDAMARGKSPRKRTAGTMGQS